MAAAPGERGIKHRFTRMKTSSPPHHLWSSFHRQDGSYAHRHAHTDTRSRTLPWRCFGMFGQTTHSLCIDRTHAVSLLSCTRVGQSAIFLGAWKQTLAGFSWLLWTHGRLSYLTELQTRRKLTACSSGSSGVPFHGASKSVWVHIHYRYSAALAQCWGCS